MSESEYFVNQIKEIPNIHVQCHVYCNLRLTSFTFMSYELVSGGGLNIYKIFVKNRD